MPRSIPNKTVPETDAATGKALPADFDAAAAAKEPVGNKKELSSGKSSVN